MILHHMPELDSFKSGKEVVFTFKKNIGSYLSKASQHDKVITIEKTAQILRKQMLQCKSQFNGNFNDEYIKKCVPGQLLQFVQSTLNGVQINSDVQTELSNEDRSLAHLLQFNCHRTYKKNGSFHKHSSERETAFIVFLGLSIYLRARKEKLMDILYENGLSISFNRVLDKFKVIGDSIVSRYVRNGVVYYLCMRMGVFTTCYNSCGCQY